ncbi:hypothetical protein [Citricoccus sp. GCM10030269]|uniref:hypothetical protein n=1 Tax=Citricoccus sp. GCM10030269 TaxID=3273388 RepID=UPI00361275FE
MAGCEPWDIGCVAGDAANSMFGGMVEGLYDGAVELAKIIGTWWMEVPPPNLDSPGLALLQQDLRFFVWVFAVIGFFFGLIRLLMDEDVRSGLVGLGKPILNLILATGVYMVAVPMLLDAGDATSRWLLDRATEGNASFDALVPPTSSLAGNYGVAFVIYLLMLLGSVVNFMFMIFRNLMLLILMAFIAVVAAASGTESGNQAWRKANAWLVALLLFKPVAAGIYALGFRMMVDDSDLSRTSDLGAGLVSALTGLLILLLACLALPMLVKFVSPAAAAGSGAFSGGAALAGAAGVAAGAAVLATGVGAGAAAGGVRAGSAAGAAASQSSGGGGGASGGGTASGGASGGESGSATAGGSELTSGATGGSAASGSSGSGSGDSGSGGSGSGGSEVGASGGAGGAGQGSESSEGQFQSGAATGAEGGKSGQDSGHSGGRRSWAEAANRVSSSAQSANQAAQGARVDRAMDEDGEQS